MKSEFLRNWDTQLKKGLLPFFVLLLIKDKEYYGYELIQDLRKKYDIDVTESTIYPLLVRLMKEELLIHKWVEQATGIPRKYYFISPQGTAILQNMKKDIIDILNKIKA